MQACILCFTKCILLYFGAILSSIHEPFKKVKGFGEISLSSANEEQFLSAGNCSFHGEVAGLEAKPSLTKLRKPREKNKTGLLGTADGESWVLLAARREVLDKVTLLSLSGENVPHILLSQQRRPSTVPSSDG